MNVIVDYGLGNINSVQTALKKAGIDTVITDDVEKIENADFVLLPGVGAFRDAIGLLKEKGLDIAIKKFADTGKPLVGICLGMQLLYEKSYEYGEYEGLGLISGEIVKLEEEKKIPHMGWNNLKIKKDDELLKYLKQDMYVYFVHSYYAKSSNDEMLAYTEYGEIIPAIVRKGNVIGFQFHPEKSGQVGANLLKALGEMINDYISSN